MLGLQCLKYLWIAFHRKEDIEVISKEADFRFQQGKLVGHYAKKLFPSGIDIPEFNAL